MGEEFKHYPSTPRCGPTIEEKVQKRENTNTLRTSCREASWAKTEKGETAKRKHKCETARQKRFQRRITAVQGEKSRHTTWREIKRENRKVAQKNKKKTPNMTGEFKEESKRHQFKRENVEKERKKTQSYLWATSVTISTRVLCF